MKKIKIFVFTIIAMTFVTTVKAITIEQKWVQNQSPISGDFLTYQRLISIGNDTVAIGNTGWNEGHNIVRYDTNGNKLWEVETDKYTEFRLNDEKIEGIYNSDLLFVLDSYDYIGNVNNLINKNIDSECPIISVNKKNYMLCYSQDKYGPTGATNLVILYELDNEFNIVNTYEKTLDFDNNSYYLTFFSYSEKDEKIVIEYYGLNNKYNLFYFDIKNEEYSDEIILDSSLYMSSTGLLYKTSGEYYEYEEKLGYSTYEKTEYYKLTDLSKRIIIDNYFFWKDEYYKDGYHYLSGFDLDGAVLYKLDENLELIWTYRYESEEEFSTLKKMVEINDFLFVLYETEIPNGVGYYEEPINPERYYSIIVLDTDGSLVTEYALDNEELKGSEFHNIIQSDDGLIIAGEIHSEDKAANAIIAELSIVFNIETKTDGNGTIKASSTTEHSGNQVTFEITPKEGYVLGEVKVTDSNGNVVIFTDYTFTMPNADVLIEATFVPENPNTVDKISLLIITIFALGLVIINNNKKRISLN